MTSQEWETVVGLEVHAELKTKTKLFCSCPNTFGNDPNTNVCPVCLGLPGSLPVLNRHAVELAMRIGAALECRIEPSVFSRKNYFYPDMPKDYQISQYDLPINLEGRLELGSGKVVGIERAHMEEDTGKNTHVGGTGRIHDAQYSLIDYNRSGVPLVEIVSRPDMGSAEEARAYVSELRSILIAIDASDGKMEEGSLRADANVSVRRRGSDALGTRCEVKNVNSLRSLGRAIDYEVARQIQLLEQGGTVKQQTRHWNEHEGRTSFGRSKEEAYDYRYFPEPDLLPLEPGADWIQRVRANLPVLPASRRKKLLEIAPEAGRQAVATVVELDLDELVLATVAQGANAKLAINRAANEIAAYIAANTEGVTRLDQCAFAKLLVLEEQAKLTATQAKTILADLLTKGGDPEKLAADRGFEALDGDALAATVGSIVGAHQAELARLKEGDQKLLGFFVGKVMAATQGKADGKAVTALLREHLEAK